MIYTFLPEAKQELYQQAYYYHQQEPRLGEEFLSEVEVAINRILTNPYTWEEIEDGVRRILTHRFPFSVLYHFYENRSEILIIAIMHTHRKPTYWQSRRF